MNNRSINLRHKNKVKKLALRSGISPQDLSYLIASYFGINSRVIGFKNKQGTYFDLEYFTQNQNQIRGNETYQVITDQQDFSETKVPQNTETKHSSPNQHSKQPISMFAGTSSYVFSPGSQTDKSNIKSQNDGNYKFISTNAAFINDIEEFENKFLDPEEDRSVVIFFLEEHNTSDLLSKMGGVMDAFKDRADFFYTTSRRDNIQHIMRRINIPLPCLCIYNGAKKVLEICLDNNTDKIGRFLNKFCLQIVQTDQYEEETIETPSENVLNVGQQDNIQQKEFLAFIDRMLENNEISDYDYLFIKCKVLEDCEVFVRTYLATNMAVEFDYNTFREAVIQVLLEKNNRQTPVQLRNNYIQNEEIDSRPNTRQEYRSQDNRRYDNTSQEIEARPDSRFQQRNYRQPQFMESPQKSINNYQKMNSFLEKFIQVASELEGKGLLEEEVVRLIKTFILEENNEVIKVIKGYLQAMYDDGELSQKLIKLAERLSTYYERPTSPFPQKNEILKFLDQFIMDRLDNFQDKDIVNNLASTGDELLYSAFDVFQADKDEDDFLDTVKRIVKTHRKKDNNKEEVISSFYQEKKKEKNDNYIASSNESIFLKKRKSKIEETYQELQNEIQEFPKRQIEQQQITSKNQTATELGDSDEEDQELREISEDSNDNSQSDYNICKNYLEEHILQFEEEEFGMTMYLLNYNDEDIIETIKSCISRENNDNIKQIVRSQFWEHMKSNFSAEEISTMDTQKKNKTSQIFAVFQSFRVESEIDDFVVNLKTVMSKDKSEIPKLDKEDSEKGEQEIQQIHSLLNFSNRQEQKQQNQSTIPEGDQIIRTLDKETEQKRELPERGSLIKVSEVAASKEFTPDKKESPTGLSKMEVKRQNSNLELHIKSPVAKYKEKERMEKELREKTEKKVDFAPGQISMIRKKPSAKPRLSMRQPNIAPKQSADMTAIIQLNDLNEILSEQIQAFYDYEVKFEEWDLLFNEMLNEYPNNEISESQKKHLAQLYHQFNLEINKAIVTYQDQGAQAAKQELLSIINIQEDHFQLNLDQKRVKKFNHFKSILNKFYDTDKSITVKQFKTYVYLFIQEDVSTLASFEVFTRTNDMKDFLESLELNDKICQKKFNLNYDEIMTYDENKVNQMKILTSFKNLLERNEIITLDTLIKNGDNTIANLYNIYQEDKKKIDFINKLKQLSKEKKEQFPEQKDFQSNYRFRLKLTEPKAMFSSQMLLQNDLNEILAKQIENFYNKEKKYVELDNIFEDMLDQFSEFLTEDNKKHLRTLYDHFNLGIHNAIQIFNNSENGFDDAKFEIIKLLEIETEQDKGLNLDQRKLKKLNHFKSILNVFKDVDRTIDIKQYKIFIYLFIYEDVSTLAAFENFVYFGKKEELLENLKLVYTISKKKFNLNYCEIEEYNESILNQLKVIASYQKNITSEEQIVMDLLIKSGDNSLIELYNAESQSQEEFIKKLKILANDKKEDLIDSRDKISAWKKNFLKNLVSNKCVPSIHNPGILYQMLDDKSDTLLLCIFRVYAVNNDLQDFAQNIELLYKKQYKKIVKAKIQELNSSLNIDNEKLQKLFKEIDKENASIKASYDVFALNTQDQNSLNEFQDTIKLVVNKL